MRRYWLLCLVLAVAAAIMLSASCGTGDDDDDDEDDDDAADDDTSDDDDDTVDDDDDTVDDDDDDDTADDTLTVMTINILNAFMNPREIDKRAQMVADEILGSEVDFIALQEVVQNGTIQNRAEKLAELTGYEYVWLRTHNLPGFFEEGIAILSRWPILWSDSRELPHPELGGVFTRAILGIGADADLGYVQYFCSHMTTSSDQDEKADQALEAFDFIESLPTGLPGYFAGDLNAEPDMPAMEFLRGEEEYGERTGNLIDAWHEANPEDPGYTFPAEDPDRRIDYVYVVPGSEGTADVMNCELVFDVPDGLLWVSDHIGILCRMKVE